ncbi:2-oxoglutarate dehydrogenase E1 subunit family protein, partial [Streptomyces tremellae]|uniref:2-oxoglutarate dehydrogenase E1 subunit family protein n=1 Tax=Streptomyces tremellae TaxID=1124239 RepID=UPI0031F0EC38
MSSQSPSNTSISTDGQDGQGANPAAAFGPNEWLVDEIYQQYLQDPNSVDRAWWDFFADYKPGSPDNKSDNTGTAAKADKPAQPVAAAPAQAPAAQPAAAPKAQAA